MSLCWLRVLVVLRSWRISDLALLVVGRELVGCGPLFSEQKTETDALDRWMLSWMRVLLDTLQIGGVIMALYVVCPSSAAARTMHGGTKFLLVELLQIVMTCRYDKTSFFCKSSDAFVRERGFFCKSFEKISMRKGLLLQKL